jgi:hypothetical protein
MFIYVHVYENKLMGSTIFIYLGGKEGGGGCHWERERASRVRGEAGIGHGGDAGEHDGGGRGHGTLQDCHAWAAGWPLYLLSTSLSLPFSFSQPLLSFLILQPFLIPFSHFFLSPPLPFTLSCPSLPFPHLTSPSLEHSF